MGTAEPDIYQVTGPLRVSIRCREMGTAERSPSRPGGRRGRAVSIRCREMGTTEPTRNGLSGSMVLSPFLFAVARWGQRNHAAMADDATPVVFLFAVARWGQRNAPACTSREGNGVSIRCREMGTAERPPATSTARQHCRAFLFAVARWGQRNWHVLHVRSDPRRVSIRCREMGTAEPAPRGARARCAGRFLFAVARWGQRNLHDRGCVGIRRAWFLFAVARWGQRNRHRAEGHDRGHWVSIRCREMGTAEPMLSQASTLLISHVSIRCREMGTAERSPSPSSCSSLASRFYSLSRDGDSGTPTRTSPVRSTRPVSIRCREMGTGNRTARRCVDNSFYTFLFAVARWGQWNPHCTARSAGRLRFLFAVARWGQPNDHVTDLPGQRRCAISIRCR